MQRWLNLVGSCRSSRRPPIQGACLLQVISEHLLEFDAPRRVQHFGESFRKLRLDRVEFLQLAPVYLAKSVNVHVLSPWCGFELSFGYTHEESEVRSSCCMTHRRLSRMKRRPNAKGRDFGRRGSEAACSLGERSLAWATISAP